MENISAHELWAAKHGNYVEDLGNFICVKDFWLHVL